MKINELILASYLLLMPTPDLVIGYICADVKNPRTIYEIRHGGKVWRFKTVPCRLL